MQQLIEALRQTGPRRFARWNDELFLAYCHGPARQLWELLPAQAPEARLRGVSDYLQLMQEAIAGDYLAGVTGPPRGFLEALLRERLPRWLSETSLLKRTQLLATVWNLAEGVTREAVWLERYALARVAELTSGETFVQQLTDLLKPVLEPAPPANWKGPYLVSVLNVRQLDEEFLPGDLHLIAPSVLCVRDRRRAVNLGVLLRHEGKSALVGILGEVAPYREEQPFPQPHWEPETVRLNSARVRLPFFHEPLRFAFAAAGFLVASTSNSQRLWIVESP